MSGKPATQTVDSTLAPNHVAADAHARNVRAADAARNVITGSSGQPVVRYITIERAAELTGYTADAIRTKIRDGIWPEQNVWVRAPDNRVLIDIAGYHTWVEMGQAYTPRVKSRLKSPSPIEAFAAANESRSSPQPLT